MKKTAFNKLKVGDRVLVSGSQDTKELFAEPGVLVDHDSGAGFVLVKFDTWAEGHGEGDHEWYFYDFDAKCFTITVDKPEKPKATKRPHGAQEYKGNGKHAWEYVTKQTERLRVPGGWLYRDSANAGATVFVPVPEVVGYAV
jgi:hypothetical protein